MIRCIAVDDDPLFLKMLSVFFEDIKEAELIETHDNPVEGMMAVVKNKPDILLLDIDMPYIDGIEALSTLENPPKVIVISGQSSIPDLGKDVNVFLSKSSIKSADVLKKAIIDVYG